MKLAITTTFNARDVSNWSGTPYYMGKAFENTGDTIEYIGNLHRQTEPLFKLKQFWKKITSNQRESPRFNIHAAKHYSAQAFNRLNALSIDAIISPQIHPICYLESKQPIILWTDGLYASLIGFYPGFSSHSASSIRQGNIITSECLSRCSLALFSSDWAARTAIEIYGIDKRKVKVVPFGANIQARNSLADVKKILALRPSAKVKLLFLGKHWDRKGGTIVFNVAKALHAAGQPVELNFVGCYPPDGIEIPDYIKCHGFISKRTIEGIKKITTLLRESHFLFVPSRAEAYGIVFCEANSFGLPCLTSHVGGISTIVKDNVNGMTFALDAEVSEYRNYIINLMQNYHEYEAMALRAFNEFDSRLNWEVSVATVKQLISNLI